MLDFQASEEVGLCKVMHEHVVLPLPTPWDLTCAEIALGEPPAKMMHRLSSITPGIRLTPSSDATETAASHLCPIKVLCGTLVAPREAVGPWASSSGWRWEVACRGLWHVAGSCLLLWGQNNQGPAGNGWKDCERRRYQLVICAGRWQASNLAPFYGGASPASARCEWNCLGWCCTLSISLSAGSAGEAFHCGGRTLLSPWQPEMESGERKEGNK